MHALQELASRLKSQDDIRRLGQALWMMVGLPVDRARLFWARSLLGIDGDQLLWTALLECGALAGADPALKPAGVAELLCSLWESDSVKPEAGRLIWTLPPQLNRPDLEDSYYRGARSLVDGATRTLTIVSPYLEPKGIGRLLEPLVGALHRGVGIVLITHDADVRSSLASAALEELRRAATGLAGRLVVYTAVNAEDTLLHSKLIIADEERIALGSANITGKGLAFNFEAGALLGASAAREASQILAALLASNLVVRAFSTT